uniref:ATP synthase subunit beta, mitochondrial-like protein n=1 Tax=Daphnia magna TaxID=35525 RepID=A0A0P6ILK9_9CRUS
MKIVTLRSNHMGLGNVVNKFHNQDSFADTSTAEETNFASLGVGCEEVDDLDTINQDFLGNVHFNEFGSFSVNGSKLVGNNRAPFINRFTNNIHKAARQFRFQLGS